MPKIALDIPKALLPLLQPARYKVMYGGRGAGKSFTVASWLVVLGLQRPLRVLCAREYQVSIKDSVHRLLADRIDALGLSAFYNVTQTSITSTNGTEFTFKGLHHNAQEIKSMEGIDLVWCFIAGTLVDNRPIETINPGDFVTSYNHKTGRLESRKVLKVHKRNAPKRLFRLTSSGLTRIIGTGEHPVFVKGKGYTPLSQIQNGDIVYGYEDGFTRKSSVQGRLWLYDRTEHARETSEVCEKWRRVLQRLCSKNVIRAHEGKQPDEQQGKPRKNEQNAPDKGTQTDNTRRQWARIYKGASNIVKRIRAWVVARTCSSDWALPRRKQFADQLQSRPCECILRNRNRIRWWKSYWRKSVGGRQEKDGILTEQRVDCVEVQEQDSLERFALSDGGNYVYNLEVEGNNNYFANGILVHNCEEAQAVSAESWDVLIPTIRKQGSEIWLTFNPLSPDDATWQRFVKNPPPGAWVQKVLFSDNPWFPEVLDDERRHLQEIDPELYQHVWLGEPRTISDAQVFKGRYLVQEFETPADARFFHGCDWGFSRDPSALVRCFIRGNVLYVDREAYGAGVELDETPQLFDSIETARKWPIKADSARPETISYMKRQGFKIEAAKKWAGSVEDGLAILKSFDKIIIHPRCVHTADEFYRYSYKVDKNNGDVLPVVVDAFNHCIAKGSLIATERGEVPIEDVTTADRVLTREGYKRVLWAGKTGENRDVMKITAGGHSLVCTPEHLIYTINRGFIRAELLKPEDVLFCNDGFKHPQELMPVAGKATVYDLAIENQHEFFAECVLVHNCIDALRYALDGYIHRGGGMKINLANLRGR